MSNGNQVMLMFHADAACICLTIRASPWPLNLGTGLRL